MKSLLETLDNELLMSEEILLLCISGVPISYIAHDVMETEDEIVRLCQKYLGFSGFTRSIINPWYYYKMSGCRKDVFRDLTSSILCGNIDEVFSACENFKKIIERINHERS